MKDSPQSWKADFETQGFVHIRGLLTAAELRELSDNLDRYITQVVPTLPGSHAFYDDRARPESLKQLQHMACDDFFRAYAAHPKWQALAQTLLGEEVQAADPEWFNKPPGTSKPTPPHQDNYYFNLKPANVVTIWMALDAIDDENGCLRYVAGSHLGGFRPHGRSQTLGFSQAITDFGPADEAREVPMHLQPGDVIAHHGMTVHRADANKSSTRQRRAFAIVYRGISCRRDEEAFANYQSALQSQHNQLGVKTT